MKSITAENLKSWVAAEKKHKLVDVRENWEHQAFNIGGLNIPMGEIMSRKTELDTSEPIVIYCEKGIRSVIVIQRLETHGFTDLYNLEGGISEWKKTI